MIARVNEATYVAPIVLRDVDGFAVTTKITSDFTAVATLQNDDAADDPTTTSMTVAHTSNGVYSQKGTFPVIGIWSIVTSVDVDGETIEDTQTVQVVTAAQVDPVAAEMTTVTPNTLGYFIKALYARPVRSGNG